MGSCTELSFRKNPKCLWCVLVIQSCPTLSDPMGVARQTSLFMEFSRQEYWSGLPFTSPKELPNPRVELWSPASQADSLPFELQGSPGPVVKKSACQCRGHGFGPGRFLILQGYFLSLGQEGPLEKGMATHSSTPAWRIPWTEEPGGL